MWIVDGKMVSVTRSPLFRSCCRALLYDYVMCLWSKFVVTTVHRPVDSDWFSHGQGGWLKTCLFGEIKFLEFLKKEHFFKKSAKIEETNVRIYKWLLNNISKTESTKRNRIWIPIYILVIQIKKKSMFYLHLYLISFSVVYTYPSTFISSIILFIIPFSLIPMHSISYK